MILPPTREGILSLAHTHNKIMLTLPASLKADFLSTYRDCESSLNAILYAVECYTLREDKALRQLAHLDIYKCDDNVPHHIKRSLNSDSLTKILISYFNHKVDNYGLEFTPISNSNHYDGILHSNAGDTYTPSLLAVSHCHQWQGVQFTSVGDILEGNLS